MFRSGICQERDWGPSWAQAGQSEGSHVLLSSQLWVQVWACEDTCTHQPAVHTTALPVQAHMLTPMITHRHLATPRTHIVSPQDKDTPGPPAVRILYA